MAGFAHPPTTAPGDPGLPEHPAQPVSTGRTGASDLIADALTGVHEAFRGLDEGRVATYIPELATADRSLFGVALAGVTGSIYTAGDADVPFTIQSLSKPFVFALALMDRGLPEVLAHVGAEPSGEGFSSIRLDPVTGRPPNPMVNAGAIVTTSLVRGDTEEERFARILHVLGAFAGRQLEVDGRVYVSESETGDRNRAIAYLMHSTGALTADVEGTLDTYFRQCSVLVTARDLARMSATLANGGVNPVTGERVVDEVVTEWVLAVMATSGMYDYAGEWLLRAGLPAKSGVSGGLVSVGVGQFGLGLFSPPLDARGNSVRSVAAAQEISRQFDLHLMHRPDRDVPTLYRSTRADRLRHLAHRTPAQLLRLRELGAAISVRAVQGTVEFAAAETILRSVDDLPSPLPSGERWLILDLHRTSRVLTLGAQLLRALVARLRAQGVHVVVVDPFERRLLAGVDHEFTTFENAQRWCEDRLLEAARGT